MFWQFTAIDSAGNHFDGSKYCGNEIIAEHFLDNRDMKSRFIGYNRNNTNKKDNSGLSVKYDEYEYLMKLSGIMLTD